MLIGTHSYLLTSKSLRGKSNSFLTFLIKDYIISKVLLSTITTNLNTNLLFEDLKCFYLRDKTLLFSIKGIFVNGCGSVTIFTVNEEKLCVLV